MSESKHKSYCNYPNDPCDCGVSPMYAPGSGFSRNPKLYTKKKPEPHPNIPLDKLRAVSSVFAEIISMAGGQLICVACSEGHEADELDVDGVLSSVSGKPGIWCHSYEDAHWPCIDRNLPTIAADLLRLAEEVEHKQKLLHRADGLLYRAEQTLRDKHLGIEGFFKHQMVLDWQHEANLRPTPATAGKPKTKEG